MTDRRPASTANPNRSNPINFRFVAFLWVTAALGGLLFGFDISIITGAGPFLIRHFKLIMAFIAFFAACIGPVFWTLVPEIFPNRVRGTAMIVPVLTQWAANAAAVLFFPVAFNQVGKAPTFAFLGVMALTQALFTWRFVPETRNKTLEEIEEQWKAGAAKPR